MRYETSIAACVCVMAAALFSPSHAAMFKWVDEKGQVQYGDRIPPQFQNQKSEELNKRGIVTKKGEAPPTPEQLQAKADADARARIDKAKEAEQKRRDNALLSTFTNEKEIDLKRDRELKVVEGSKDTIRLSLKQVGERIAEMRKSPAAAAPKDKAGKDAKKGANPAVDDLARAEADRLKLEEQLADKDKEMVAIRAEYEEQKRRYIELKVKETPARK